MFSLRKGDVYSLIETEGIPYYACGREEFLGYLPSLKTGFVLTEENLPRCEKNLVENNYEVAIHDSLIKISSLQKHIPANSLLYKNLWKTKAEKLLDIDENFSLLISSRSEVPFFCGHDKFINRLADNFAGDIRIVNALDFMKKWE